MTERGSQYQFYQSKNERYKGRQTGGESFYFNNTALESYLYKSTEQTLIKHGISKIAQENWAIRIANLKTPTVDCQGNSRFFANFAEFESYLQNFYDNLVRSGTARLLRR